MTAREKQALVKQFLRGQSIADLGVYFACTDRRVQTVLREAITGLVDLNTALGVELRTLRESEPTPAMGSV